MNTKTTTSGSAAKPAPAPVGNTIKEDGDVKAVEALGEDPATTSLADAAQDNYIKPEELPESTKVTPPAEQILGPGPVGELQRFDKEDKGLDDPQLLPPIEGDDPSKRGRKAVEDLD